MNNVYTITNRKLKDTNKTHILVYGKLSHFVEKEVRDEKESKKIMITFSKSGFDMIEYISDNWIIRYRPIIRKKSKG